VASSGLRTGAGVFDTGATRHRGAFTSVNETLHGLLTGTKIGDNLIITIAWCVGVAVLSRFRVLVWTELSG
jgi:hypothetical protein